MFAVVSVGVLYAGDGVWKNGEAKTANWSDAVNWTGDVPGGTVANSDKADFSLKPTVSQEIILPTLGWPRVWYVGSVAGDAGYTFVGPTSGAYLRSVGNPNGFEGRWIVGPAPRNVLQSTSSTTFNPEFTVVSNMSCSIVRNAGKTGEGKVVVGSFTGAGTALINGPDYSSTTTKGLVSIRCAGGAGQHIGVFDGDLELSGSVDNHTASGLDLGTLSLAVGTSLLVAEGTVKVADLKSGDSTFAKNGPGTLEVQNIYGPENLNVTVVDGALAFKAADDEPETGPATDPYLWLDASLTNAAHMEWMQVGESRFVSKWHDVRGASRPGGDLVPYVDNGDEHGPRLVANVGPQGDLFVLDFGMSVSRTRATEPWPAETFGYFGIPYGTTARIREAFVVCRRTTTEGAFHLFGSDNNLDLLGGTGEYGLINTGNSSARSLSALLRQNGSPIVDIRTADSPLTDLCVISMVCREPLVVALIGSDRRLSAGGVQFGEILYYDRELSEAERRANESYLMQKWLGVRHPAADPVKLGAVTFDSGATCRLESDRSVRIDKVTSPNDLVKAGRGTVDIAALALSDSSISVTEGTLGIGSVDAMTAVSNALDNAFLHIDAQKEDSFEYSDIPGCGDSVVKWYDVRGVRYVKSDISEANFTNAVRRTDGQTGLAVGRPYVDCLKLRSRTVANQDAAALSWSEKSKAVREVHLVLADDDDCGGQWLGWTNGNDLDRMFLRNNSSHHGHGLFEPAWAKIAAAGDIWVDGVKVDNATYELSSGFHVLTVVVTDDCYVNTFGRDRNSTLGGFKLAEAIVFESALDQSTSRALHDYLRRKWQDAGTGARSRISSLTVAQNANLNLNFDFKSPLSVDGIAVSGPVSLSGVMTIGLSATGSFMVESGRYKLIDSMCFGEAIPQLRLKADRSAFRKGTALTVLDDGVYVDVPPPSGLILIVR